MIYSLITLLASIVLSQTLKSQILKITFFLVICVKYIFLFLVNEYQILEFKLAGDYSIKMYESLFQDSIDSTPYLTFLPQTILNIIPLSLGIEPRMIIVSTNFLMINLIQFNLLKKIEHNLIVSFSILLIPALFNFSLFGLRDPVIFYFLFMSTFYYYEKKYIIAAALFSPVFFSRPENISIIALVVGIHFFLKFHNNYNIISLLKLIILLPLAFFSIQFIFSYVLQNFGIIANETSLIDLIDQLSLNRIDRTTRDFGDGSNYINADLIKNTPFYQRIAIQLIGFIILPFPFNLRGGLDLIVFFDSILFISLFFYSIKNRLKHRTHFILLFFGIIFSNSILVFNAGNAFRMRLAIWAVLLGYLNYNFSINKIINKK